MIETNDTAYNLGNHSTEIQCNNYSPIELPEPMGYGLIFMLVAITFISFYCEYKK